MIEFNETILQTRKKRFYLGIQRIMLCLALMLGLFTAGRRTAILKLQYKHLRISLLRNPHGGPPILDIAIKPEYIKSLLGITNLYATPMSAGKVKSDVMAGIRFLFLRSFSVSLLCSARTCLLWDYYCTRRLSRLIFNPWTMFVVFS
jgi:Protein of unknown function (DUF3435)